MNQMVSLLISGNTAVGAPSTADAGRNVRSEKADAPFSSMLDRAERRTPERRNHTTKTAAQRSTRTERSRDDQSDVSTQPRKRERVDEKKKPADETAGTAAITCSPEPKVVPEETVTLIDATGEAPANETTTEATTNSVSNPASAGVTVGNATSTTTTAATNGVSAIQNAAADGTVTLPADVFIATNEPEIAAPLNALSTATTTDANTAATPGTTADLLATISQSTAPATTLDVRLVTTDLSTASDPLADAAAAKAGTTAEGTLLTASSARAAEVLLAANAEPTTEAVTVPTGAADATATAAVLPEEARLMSRAARRFRAEATETVDGTGGAKSSMTMKNAIKTEEVAGLNQQILPGSPVSTGSNLPSDLRRSVTELSTPTHSGVEATQLAAKNSPAPVRADLNGAEELAATPTLAPLARAGELISREVRMFKRTGDDQVEVVLTPDAKTQISLRLQWREGQVEVQARCDFGDYGSLNNQWSQLQASMANQGVRLSHLSERTTTGFTEFFNNPNFSQQQSSGRERNGDGFTPRTDSLPSLTPATKTAAKTPSRSGNRLFDSWA